MLIIGSRGFLGSYLARCASPKFDVLEGNRTSSAGASDFRIDVREPSSVNDTFVAARPDIVVLLAAYSDIDFCEKFPDEAKAVNLRGAEHVAGACAQTGARLVFASTGAVFDGKTHGYTEQSPVSPVSVYGETKARAESLITALLLDALVVRIALAVGFALRPDAPGFLNNLEKRWAAGESVAMPVFESRNPIDPVSCSQFVIELIEKNALGIFHVGSKDPISRYDLCTRFASRMGFPDRVTAQYEPTPGRAPRGPDHFLLTEKLRSACKTQIPSSDQVIERCFDAVA
jgi:dTDP-4-dehydrorhamnose reductase